MTYKQIKQAVLFAVLVAVGCVASDGDDIEDNLRSSPDITNTVTHTASGASVTYDFWHFDDVDSAALVQFTVNAWPSSGNGPVYLSDTYLDVVVEKDALGAWQATGTFTQPPQAGPCNNRECNGVSCRDWAGNCNCFTDGQGTCGHGWCSGGGGGYTPIVLDVTFN